MRSIFYLILILIIMAGCSSEGNVISDEPISVVEYKYVEHNQWIYAQMNHNYLWREDLPDSLDCDYTLTPPDFYNSILSSKDRFSYITTNSYYNPPEECNYGIAYQLYSDIKGNQAIQILYATAYIEQQYGIKRGDYFRIIDQSNESLTLQRVELNDNNIFETVKADAVMLSNRVNSYNSTVLLDSIYHIGNNKIGYICYLEYNQRSDLYPSLQKIFNNNITDLILDLRYNPGGYVSTCRYLCNCIVSENGYNAIFQQCSYNDILSKYYLETIGSELTFEYYEDLNNLQENILGTPKVPLKLNRLYVLTSSHTASASEATIICLRPFMEVVVIGETTTGKGVGSTSFFDSRYKYMIQPIIMRYYNANGETTPDDGLIPDYYVSDGYSVSTSRLGQVEEPLLSKALQLICPEIPSDIKGLYKGKPLPKIVPIGEPSYVIEHNKKIKYKNIYN